MGIFRRRVEQAQPVASGPLCSCGTALDVVDMDYGFQLSDEVFAIPQDERRSRLGGLGKVFVLDQSRGFVRTVLPVRLDHGSVRFGIWLEIPAEQAEEALKVWDGPAYASQSYAGTVANFLAPWGDVLLGAEASARSVGQ